MRGFTSLAAVAAAVNVASGHAVPLHSMRASSLAPHASQASMEPHVSKALHISQNLKISQTSHASYASHAPHKSPASHGLLSPADDGPSMEDFPFDWALASSLAGLTGPPPSATEYEYVTNTHPPATRTGTAQSESSLTPGPTESATGVLTRPRSSMTTMASSVIVDSTPVTTSEGSIDITRPASKLSTTSPRHSTLSIKISEPSSTAESS